MSGLDLSLHMDTSDFIKGADEIQRKQLPMATAWALNDTAQDVLEHIQHRMEVVFDEPTRFTKNAFHVWRAKKSNLVAKVQERPSVGSKHYLKVQERGGRRPKTGLERMLSSSLAYDGILAAIAPAAGAKRNRFGNWAPGQRNQAISAIKGWSETGYKANATKGSAARNRSRAAYFVPQKSSNLTPGIYKRTGRGKREKIVKIAHFLDSLPSYSERLGFHDGAEQVFESQFPMHFRRAFKKAMSTRR
ncbi:hypothetical protein [Phaeobacter inhibens]|uniref:Uncharacterized protein n=1 Tax=Phaeobacter inhibens TaxID=221822 RepID=A0A2I7KHB7_9RHOB|nr:hypothetical protein [Phaeobacter inhibens]AUR01987.1 hypothetical protein PhaeoP88_04675 [Phaeobacter inhibens]